MGDTGWKDPTSDGSERDDWSYETRCYTADNNYSYCGTASDKDEEDYYDFGLVVPAGATITGVELSVDGWARSEAHPLDLDAKLTWDGFSSYTGWEYLTWEEAEGRLYKSYGDGATELWGRAWSASELSDANFGVFFHCSGGGGFLSDNRVYHVRVKVHYILRRIFVTHQ